MSDVLIGNSYPVFWCVSRSGYATTGLTPSLFAFREQDSTPMYTGTFGAVNIFTGVYFNSISVINLLGFVEGASYSLWATGNVSGSLPVREFVGRMNVKATTFDGLSSLSNSVYHAQIDHCYVKPSGLDRWTTLWFKNGAPYANWATGILNVFDSGGNLYFGNSGLTAYGTNISGGQLTVGGSLVLKSGERYLAQTTAVIDDSTRMWSEHIGYDIN